MTKMIFCNGKKNERERKTISVISMLCVSFQNVCVDRDSSGVECTALQVNTKL